MTTKPRATIEDLYNVAENGKAELVNGEILPMSPTGGLPNRAAGAIYLSLRLYERTGIAGRAYTDNAGFRVNLPQRQSFSPDAAFYVGPDPDAEFLPGAPVFAAEVRSAGDYGPQAEQAIIAKRLDYFAAGTLVVWDVDVLKEQVIRVFRSDNPHNPMLYHRGDNAEAEPAVAGWQMPVDELFL